MKRPSRAACAIGTAGAALPLTGARAGEPLRVAQLDCARGVQLSARATPLSQVLKRMAEVMNFRLDDWADDDPPIDLDTRQAPLDLMNALSLRADLMVRYGADRGCPGHWRVTRVGVLPGASRSRAAAAGVGGAPPMALAAGQPPTETDPGHREHLLAHGVRLEPAAAPGSRPVAAPSAASATAEAAVGPPAGPLRAAR